MKYPNGLIGAHPQEVKKVRNMLLGVVNIYFATHQCLLKDWFDWCTTWVWGTRCSLPSFTWMAFWKCPMPIRFIPSLRSHRYQLFQVQITQHGGFQPELSDQYTILQTLLLFFTQYYVRVRRAIRELASALRRTKFWCWQCCEFCVPNSIVFSRRWSRYLRRAFYGWEKADKSRDLDQRIICTQCNGRNGKPKADVSDDQRKVESTEGWQGLLTQDTVLSIRYGNSTVTHWAHSVGINLPYSIAVRQRKAK